MSGGQHRSTLVIRTADAADGHAMPAPRTTPPRALPDGVGPVAPQAAGGAGRHRRVPAPTSAEAA
ncbi:hypothetical protein ACFV2S_20590 [Streptomyces sp. NPDC059695]|uniref:hypothetical protein n=1 Tax=Streptomyces sp. NPDC059695 TaxID=3346910 RepID=UPI003694DCE2